MTLLAAMDQDGFAQFASVPNLAHRALVSLEAAQQAVERLSSPDENSADPDNEGRRIERVPGGWMVLNAAKYQALVTRANAREKTRLRVAKHRERNVSVTASNASVEPVTGPYADVRQSEIDAETDVQLQEENDAEANASASEVAPLIDELFGPESAERTTARAHKAAIGPTDTGFEEFWQAYPPRNGRREKKAEARMEWKKLSPNAALRAVIVAALAVYGRSTDKPVDACRYLKHRRWEDESVAGHRVAKGSMGAVLRSAERRFAPRSERVVS